MKRIVIAFIIFTQAMFAQQQSKDSPPTQYIQTSGQVLTFANAPGSGTITLEYLFTSVSAPTITVQGCAQGGTCTTLTALSGTNPYTTATNAMVQFAGGYFSYTVTATYMGTGAITVNFVGIQAKSGSGGGGGALPANLTGVQTDGTGTASQQTSANAVSVLNTSPTTTLAPALLPSMTAQIVPLTYSNPLTVDAEWAFNTGSGTTVPDITGNGHDGTFGTSTASPTWGPYGVDFLKANSITSPAQTVATNVTTWASGCWAVEPYSSPVSTGLAGGASPAAQFPSFFASSNNTGVSVLGGAQGNNKASIGIEVGMLKNGTSAQSAVQQGYAQLHTFCVVPGIPDAYYVDGILQPLLSANASAAPTTSTGFYQFGVGSGGALWSFKGTILYATLSTGTSWTAAQVLSETRYIQQKIALRPLPTYAKTGVRANQVVIAGNSIYSGALGTGVWSTHLALTNTYTVLNTSQFGKNLADMDWAAESSWITQLAIAGRNVVFIGEPSNDLCGDNFTAAFAWEAAQSAIHKALAQGAVPVIGTTISRSGCDAVFLPYNALVRNGAYQAGAVAIFDNAERQEFSPNGTNSTNTTFYNADGTHLTGGTALNFTTGYGLYAAGASKIVNTLDGSSAANPDATASNAFTATDANNYVIQTPTAAATHALVDCAWITGKTKTIVNGSATFSITASVQATTVSGSPATSSILGSTTIAPNQTAIFTSVLTSPTAGGCSWLRQQMQ